MKKLSMLSCVSAVALVVGVGVATAMQAPPPNLCVVASVKLADAQAYLDELAAARKAAQEVRDHDCKGGVPSRPAPKCASAMRAYEDANKRWEAQTATVAKLQKAKDEACKK